MNLEIHTKMSNGVNDPRLPYQDDAFDDEPRIGSSDDDLLEEAEEMNEQQARADI